MTQGQLAGRVRLTRTSICNIEAGRQRVPIHVLMDISKVLNCQGADLLEWAVIL